MTSKSALQKIKQLTKLTCLGSVTFAGICIYRGDEHFYSHFLMPLLQNWIIKDAETAHRLAIWAAKNNLLVAPPRTRAELKSNHQNPLLTSSVFGLSFSNPVGVAAGFDKNAEAVEGMHNLGFGFVEIGSVTPRAQPGNPIPRVFRLTEDQAIINRYGFNSEGHDVVYERLDNTIKKLNAYAQPMSVQGVSVTSIKYQSNASRSELQKYKPVIGVNLGKNKDSPLDSVQDYVDGVNKFGCIADYLVVNISSPNTSGLRKLQERGHIQSLIKEVITARNNLVLGHGSKKPPLLIKIAPDLTDDDKEDIAEVIMTSDFKIDGIIVSNTTISRPDTLQGTCKSEIGGLSGSPLKQLSTQTIFDMYKLTKGEVPIIGVGGISSGQDAYDKIIAGASLVQLYTAFVYIGPPIASKITNDLENILKENKFLNVQEAVGSAHRQ